MKRTPNYIAFIFLSFLLVGGIVRTKAQPFLSPTDTLFLQSFSGGEKFITYTLRPGQTAYSVGRYFGLKLGQLKSYNPQVDFNNVRANETLKIPIPNQSLHRYYSDNLQDSTWIPVCFEVQRGQTMYHISKRLFQMPIDTIMERNKLLDIHLLPGQMIQVAWFDINGIPDSLQLHSKAYLSEEHRRFEQRYLLELASKKEILKKGTVFQLAENNSKELVCLHRSAKKGSIIKLVNPMNDRSLYLKVIGGVPEHMEAKIEVVLSKGASRFLDAIDPYYYAHIYTLID